MITTTSLGDIEFKTDYNVACAYVAGAMYKGIASRALVAAMGKAGFLGFFGTGGLDVDEIETAIRGLQSDLRDRQPYGMNLLSNLEQPELEERTIDLYLRHSVHHVEAAAYMRMTPALVRYRLAGLALRPDGTVAAANRIMAKVSRPEVAAAFLDPAPASLVRELLAARRITAEQAALAARVPMADDLCVESDSGGHTDRGVAFALLPAMQTLRDDKMSQHGYRKRVRVGAAGGIGTPAAAAAAFVMGADFILTGSINQCTREAGTSDAAKEILQQLDVNDTAYAPAGDLFELGAKVQVAKLGLLFPARANKLYELYLRHDSLGEIDARTRQQLEEKYFKRSFDDVWNETRARYAATHADRVAQAERNPKQKMAAVFKWYFAHSTRLALAGDRAQKIDFQIHCGPALGSFNRWVKGTPLEPWQNRSVADLARRIMDGTAELLNRRFSAMQSPHPGDRHES